MIDIDRIQDSAIAVIAEKVLEGEPVDYEDALAMLRTTDILGLGSVANHVREQINRDEAYYGVTINLNYTNICELRCPLCAFSRDACDPDAYLYTLDDIEARVKKALALGVDEVHIVGGLNPDLTIEYFEEMLQRIKILKPDIFIVAFTATEYDYFARLNNIPLKEVFQRFIRAGLGALPGGGAEIFAPDKRRVIAPRKISGERWLAVMRTAHSLGLKTNATMLYHHIEDDEDVADHLIAIRNLQDETGGFKTFVPLRFHDVTTRIKSKKTVSTGFDDIRIYATARVVLHNVPHFKALWMYLGEKMAQVMLRFGADDIGATYHDEKVVHAAGAATPDYGSEPFLRRLIQGAGREPVRTTADYSGISRREAQ